MHVRKCAVLGCKRVTEVAAAIMALCQCRATHHPESEGTMQIAMSEVRSQKPSQ